MNIIDILKRKIKRKLVEHVKHKASLRAFDDNMKDLGDNKTKFEQLQIH